MIAFGRLDPRSSFVDISVVAWLAFTSPLLLVHPSGADLLRVAVHGVLIALVLLLRRRLAATPPQGQLLFRLVHACYPFVLLSYVYKELDVLQRKVGGQFFDGLVEAWEQALFGSSPAAWLSGALPYPWLSELLHLSYVSFYLLLPLLALSVLLRGDARGFQVVTWTGINAFLACYLVSMVFPVQGPRPLYPLLDPNLRGVFWSVSHALCAQGAANGAAFPSGHVAVSLVTALCAWRWHRSLFPVFAVGAALVSLATVYGRYHYAVDVLAGVALALALAWAGPRSYDWLHRRCAGEGEWPARERACA